MAKVMLINVTHAEESRVAIVADGTLVSFEIESCNREHLKGNIYKGVVQRVQPALEAAFVDIGAERNAFLPLDEICFRHLPQPVRLTTNGERRRPRIQDLLKPGDEILVQIVKEQFGSKPPTLTTFYSLPGRFLVLLPGSDEAGISRRIEGADRVRVREMMEKLRPPEGFGIIVRTVVSFDPGLADLQRDLTYLLRLWESIQQAAMHKTAPALVYREHDLVLRNIRDYFTPDIDEIYVDNEEVFERARQFLRDVMPEKEGVLRLYQGDKPIFSYFDIESQIESIFKRRVPLKSGGYIVIDGTEALTAIDVNSGRSLRGVNQEETAFRTNLEAAVEIARQLRLRDLGGLIVIDFIDMRNPQHINEVEKALRMAMAEDKARHEVGRISHFGLLEVSRQRLRPAATATTYVSCPMCDGYGLVRTTESAALVALRKVHNRVAQGDVDAAHVALPPEVAMYLLNQKREDLAQLERRYNCKIVVAPRTDLMPHQCDIETKPRREPAATAAPPVIPRGGVALESPFPPLESLDQKALAGAFNESATSAERKRDVGAVVEPLLTAQGVPVSESSKQAKRKRRRGRRRGKGRLAAAALQEALSALASSTTRAVQEQYWPTLSGDPVGGDGRSVPAYQGPMEQVSQAGEATLPDDSASSSILVGQTTGTLPESESQVEVQSGGEEGAASSMEGFAVVAEGPISTELAGAEATETTLPDVANASTMVEGQAAPAPARRRRRSVSTRGRRRKRDETEQHVEAEQQGKALQDGGTSHTTGTRKSRSVGATRRRQSQSTRKKVAKSSQDSSTGSGKAAGKTARSRRKTRGQTASDDTSTVA